MKRITTMIMLGVLLVGIATIVFWHQFSETFGPMEQDESQCLICCRHRVTKTVCGTVRNDAITSNIYSDWIDTFTSKEHQHVWSGGTHYHRAHWFGDKSIGCGGIPAIPQIFTSRKSLGEIKAQQLVTKFQELVNRQSPKFNYHELQSFSKAVAEDPESLLKTDLLD